MEDVLSVTVSDLLIGRLYLHPAARDCQVRKLRCSELSEGSGQTLKQNKR